VWAPLAFTYKHQSGKVLDDSAQNVKLVGDSCMAHYKPAAGNSSLQLATLIISFCIGFQNAGVASPKYHPISFLKTQNVPKI
jgi:hypothetical protein